MSDVLKSQKEDTALALPGTIPLVAVIQQLREDLQEAVVAARSQGLAGQSQEKVRLTVQELELELQVVASQSHGIKDGGGVGLKLYVLEAKGSTEVAEQYSTSVLQKLRLKLKPELEDPDGTARAVEVAASGDIPGLDD